MAEESEEIGERKEIRVEARVRNNILWHAIFDQYKSVAEFCRRAQLNGRAAEIGRLLNLKESPLDRAGQFRPFAIRLGIFFKMLPEDLFPEGLYGVKKQYTVVEISLRQLPFSMQQLQLPASQEVTLINEEKETAIRAVLKNLTRREEAVITGLFGIAGSETSVEALAVKYHTTPRAIRQTKARALRRLRRPEYSRSLCVFIEG